MKNHAEEKLDPRLREYLKLLRPVPRRDPLAAARTKANFLAELEVLFEPSTPVQPKSPVSPGFLSFLSAVIKRPLGSHKSLPRTALSFSSILLIVAVLLFGWVGITARAAESALPGDTLYSFKTSMEQVQLSLSSDLDKQAGLYLEFASHRLQEIEMLVDAGRYQKAVALSVKFHQNIQKALEITNDLAKVNPARAAQRRNEINSKLASFAAQLNELMGKMPPAYQPAFNGVFPPSQSEAPTPATPSVTQTPDPAIKHGTQQNGLSNKPNKPNDGSDPGLINGGDTGSDTEQNSGISPESGPGNGVQEEPAGNNESFIPGYNGGYDPGNNPGYNPTGNPEYDPGYNPGSNNLGSEAGHNSEQANPDSSQSGESIPSS